MNNVLLWVGGLLVAVLALLFAVPYAVDWNSYRGVFEEEASRLLGRDVRVGGRVDLRLLPKPFVRFEKVRIADVGRMQGEPFFRAESFTLWLSIPPLLRGAIEANDVELDKPILNLAVDDQGVGNWRSLQVTPGALPFVPSDVALQAVRIRDGAVTFRDLATRAAVSLTGIEGELSAPALNGPFRFRGDLLSEGERHEVRLNTAVMEADGKLRLKASVRTLDNQNTYALDAAITDLSARPRLEGSLAAKLPLAPGGTGQGQSAVPVVFELQSQLAADSKGARLSDINLGFEQDGRPQLLTGTMTATWGDERSTNLELQSRWLDLDRVSGGGARPLDAVRDLAGRLAALIPQGGISRAAIGVEQVNLGGEAVSAVNMALVRRGGALLLEDLSGLVPGNGRLAVQGRFGTAQGRTPPPFAGDLMVRGVSLQRFLTWAFPGQSVVAGTKSEAPFALAGALSLDGERVALRDASLELHGARLSGSIEHRGGDVPELTIAVDGDNVDLSALAPELVRLGAWRGVLGIETAAVAGDGVLQRIASRGTLKLDVRAGRLSDGATTLHDVVANIAVARGRLDIPTLHLRTAEGLSLDATTALEGQVGRQQGMVTGWVTAPSSDAAQILARQLAALVPALELVVSPDGISQLAPLDLGFAATFAKAPSQRVSVKVDGTAAGSLISSQATFDGGLVNWRKSPIDIAARVSGNIAAFAAGLQGRAGMSGSGGAAPPGNVTLKLAGANAESLTALIEIDGAPVKASLRGRVAVREGAGAAEINGDLSLSAKDAAAALDILAPQLRLRLHDIGVDGVMAITRTGNVLTVAPRGLKLNGAELAGELTLSASGGGTHIGGRLAAARASLVDVMAIAVDRRTRTGTGDAIGLASVWPDDVFDFSALGGIDARVVLAFASLDMGNGLVVSDANLELVVAQDRVNISRLEGRALGGMLLAHLDLTRATGGADLVVSGKLGPVMLADAAGSGAAGNSTVEFSARARAASLRGIATALAGKGEVVLADARFVGLDPLAIDRLVDQQLASSTAPSRQDLIAAARRALGGTALRVGNRRLAVDIADGAAKIAPFDVVIEGGRAGNTTTLDLLTLKVDSEWTLASTRRKPGVGGELPGVSLIYVSPLSEVLVAEPRISVEALERELSVRRMERDVEKLEQLRREDEERARRERERRDATNAGGPGEDVNDAPVIEAPLPIPGQRNEAGEQRSATPPSSSGAARRPPVKTEARPRSLEDVLQAR